MSVSDHLFIQPWLNPDETWAGFRIVFIGDDASYDSAVAGLTAHPALESLGRLPWFIPVTTPGTFANLAGLPGHHAVFLLPPPGKDDTPAYLEADLRRAGATLGLVLAPDRPLPASGAWNYVVISASHARTLAPHSLANLAKKSTVAVTGLRSRTDFVWAVSNDCSLVSCEYLLNRSFPCNKPDMQRVRLLKLLTLIAEDADTWEIEEIFRQEPKLAYGLLRLVNSAAMAPRSPITSFAQAITILGRQHLQRWLQLLVYADPNDGQHPNPLLLQAATRGRLMEVLASRIRPAPEDEISPDAVFMIGTFSLLDVLLNLSMPEILLQLPLPPVVHTALQEQRGPLGKLLTALGAADNQEFRRAGALLAELGVDGETFLAAQLSALQWADGIRAATA